MPTTLLDHGDIWLDRDFLPDSRNVYDEMAAGLVWDERMQARKAASFGVPYNYSGIVWPAAPFPPLIDQLREKVAKRVGFEPNNSLVNYYPDGSARMGFHRDEAELIEPYTGFAILSLGAERTITFRSEVDRSLMERYFLPSGSLLYMTAVMQADWKHAILPDDTVRAGRISLTFRRLRGVPI